MKIPVIYIAGWGRSGSTLLGNMLGSIEGLQHIGEMAYFWEHGWKYNHLCGCGVKFQECAFWNEVIKESFGGFDMIDVDTMINIRNRFISNKKVFASFVLGIERGDKLIQEYVCSLRDLYKSIHIVGKNAIIVDSSKIPFHCFLLSLTKEIDLYIIHLVRDSRGCAYSWLKVVNRDDADYSKKIQLERFDSFGSTLRWNFWNTIFELFKKRFKYIRIRYEDFVKDPINAIRAIGELVGFYVPWTDLSEITIRTNHTVWGNPSRMRTGKVEIRLDDAWRRNMPLKDRLLVTALSWPWLLKYGYLGKTA